MRIIGIDPGLLGALVALEADGQLAGCWDAPTVAVERGRDYRYDEMGGLLLEARGGRDAVAYLEYARPMPKEGVLSSFKSGCGFGAWLALLAAHGIPVRIVKPRDWQKEACAAVAAEGKWRSCIAAVRLFPDLDLHGPKGGARDGRADAALIAWYGRRCELTGRPVGRAA